MVQLKLPSIPCSQPPHKQEVSLLPGTTLGNSDAAWSSSSLTAGLEWHFSTIPTTGMERTSTTVSSVTSPLLAEV